MADFPQFRKYPNHKTWFKILSESEMVELKVLGNFYNLNHFKAVTFVDRNLIGDMIQNETDNWLVIEENEFENEKEYCEKHRTLNSSL